LIQKGKHLGNTQIRIIKEKNATTTPNKPAASMRVDFGSKHFPNLQMVGDRKH